MTFVRTILIRLVARGSKITIVVHVHADRWRPVSAAAPPAGEACVRGSALLHLLLAHVEVGAVSDAGREGVWGRDTVPGDGVSQEHGTEGGPEEVSGRHRSVHVDRKCMGSHLAFTKPPITE